MNEYLHIKLKEYSSTGAYPFHMPGHKRRTPEELRGTNVPGQCSVPYDIDITEIDGFDNLHHAEGILKEAQQRAARLYESEESYYLINGSTGGILSAVSACTTMNGKLLMARNCHKAAYHSAQIRGLQTSYLYPEILRIYHSNNKSLEGVDEYDNVIILNGPIRPEDVENALQADLEIQAVLITSPTYDGVVSDVKRIAEVAHKYGVPLIVDEAHGAHFGFHPCFPESSVKLGADIVIHSLHKTLPSMTQTAVLHVNGSLVDRNRLREYLGIYQTSSPSYVLMAGMDRCVKVLEEQGEELFDAFAQRLKRFRDAAGMLKNVKVLEIGTVSGTQQTGQSKKESGEKTIIADPSKILITVRGRSGIWIADILRQRYHLEMEMETAEYALALTSVADTEAGFERLLAALRELDEELQNAECVVKPAVKPEVPAAGKQILTIAIARETPGRTVLFEESAGKTSKEYVYLYPPGIPLLVPGEEISEAILEQLLQYREAGMSLQGMKDYSGKTIEVCDQ